MKPSDAAVPVRESRKSALDGLIPTDLNQHLAGSQSFYAERGQRRGPASLAELTAARRQLDALPGPAAAAERVTGPTGSAVDIQVTLPREGDVQAVHLDIPGGGFYLGPTPSGRDRAAALAQSLRAAVVNVHYRLAPEAPWPAAPDDCEVAAQWLVEHSHERFGTEVISIGGSSAGATLAAVVLLRCGTSRNSPGLASRNSPWGPSCRLVGGRLLVVAIGRGW
jgi:acetyl esterase